MSDTERIDWIFSHKFDVAFTLFGEWMCSNEVHRFFGTTPRKAIDAAIEELGK